MRLHLLVLGIIVAGLWYTGDFSPSAAAAATARPTPTIKACHICDEEIIPAATPTAESAPQDEPVVRAVMFWMDTCPHCHMVLDEVLPPLQQKYGDQLQVHLIEVNSEEIWNQMVQVATALGFPSDRLGVPFLVIGDKALIGSGQIPAELPGLIEQHLAAGGLDYPAIPALAPLLPPTVPAVKEITPQPTATPTVDSGQTGAEEPVARVVMFWSNNCPHCHDVLDKVLPPLQQQYRDRLEILLVETSSPDKAELLFQAAETFGIPREHIGVPFLVIGDTPLLGSVEIPGQLPGLIEEHLAAGGVDYPDIPGLAPLLPVAIPAAEQVAPPTADPSQAGTEEPLQASPTFTPTPAPAVQLITNPPASATPDGFELAIGLMVGMVIALFYAAVTAIRGLKNGSALTLPVWLDWAIPLLSLIGLGVAGYLAYVETQPVLAVCGPVGDCNAVQNSPYATLLGVLPVGVLGAAGYIGILAAWLWWRFGPGPLADYMPLAIFGMTFFGVLFSLYLTYLEPFVIQAVCMWCLTSAVLITLLMLLSLNPALQTVRAQTGERKV